MTQTKLLCPFCKDADGRFIRHSTEMVLVLEDDNENQTDEFLCSNESDKYGCDACGLEIEDGNFFNPKED